MSSIFFFHIFSILFPDGVGGRYCGKECQTKDWALGHQGRCLLHRSNSLVPKSVASKSSDETLLNNLLIELGLTKPAYFYSTWEEARAVALGKKERGRPVPLRQVQPLPAIRILTISLQRGMECG